MNTERTFGVTVRKKSLRGQRIQDKWKGQQLNFKFRHAPGYTTDEPEDDIPVAVRINRELDKNGSHT